MAKKKKPIKKDAKKKVSSKGLKTSEPKYVLKKDFEKSCNRIDKDIYYLRSKLQDSRLIRRVRIDSPNGTVTTEETFSSEK